MVDYRIKYSELISRIRKTRRKETQLLFVTGLLNILSILLITILISSVVELIANGDNTFRTFLAGVIFIISLVAFVYFLFPTILRFTGKKYKPTIEDFALRIGNFYPEIKDKICNIIQLVSKIDKKEIRPDNTSKELTLAAFEDISNQAMTKDFNEVIEKSKLKKSFFYFSITSIAIFILFLIFQSSLGASFYRIVNFNKSFIPPAPFTLKIHPKKLTILKGSKAIIEVKANGNSPDKIKLFIKEDKQKEFDEYLLSADSVGYFSFEFPSLKESILYYAEAEWINTKVSSDTGAINVSEKPFIRAFSGSINFPSYTKLSSKKIDEQNANISALMGSKVSINLIANKNLKYADIFIEVNNNKAVLDTSNTSEVNKKYISDTLRYKMQIDGKKAYGSFPVKNSGNYYIKIYDYSGNDNQDPIKYSINALKDDYPTISLIEPIQDVQIDERALLPIKVAIADDYGFSRLKLHYKLLQSRYSQPMDDYKSISIPILSNELAIEVPYLWNLNNVKISPDDIYEYFLEVLDNDIVSGPKSSRTQTLRVKLPSLEEVLNQVDKEQEKIEKELDKVMQKAENVKKELQELNQELLKKQDLKNLDWKDQKKAEEIIKKQEEIQQKLSDIQKNLEKMTQSLQDKNAISQETLEKYLELQKLMNEVNSPELRNLQQNLEKAMKQMTPEQIQEAMKQVKFDEEKFRKSIERTMNILKRLKAEQKADAIKKQADDLTEKQKDLEKQTENTNSENKEKIDELAKKQENLKEDFNKMSDELKELEKLMKELSDMPMEEMQKAKETLNEQSTQNEMNNAKNSIQKGDMNNAKKSQQNASSNLKNFSQQMKKLKDKMQEKGMKEAIRQMQKAISDMLKLSESQEKVKAKTQSSDYNSTQLRDLLAEQAKVSQALSNTINGLSELSQKSFAVTPQMSKQLGDALKNMENALKQMNEGNTENAAKSQSGAMSAMNKAAMNMQSMLSQMQKSGSCSNPNGSGSSGEGEQGQGNNPMMNPENFSQYMQQLANQQQALNQMMQKMGNNQGSLSPEEQAQFGRIATEQNQIKKSLEQLAEEQKKSMQKDGKKLGLGSLDKIADEMKETISDLQQGRINPNTLKRQERILSRMLDASRSIHERDRETTRESEVGFDKSRKSPIQLDLNTQEGKKKAMQDLLKSIQQGYTKDYETLIRKYFEALQSEQKNLE
jgi:DNA repair exonuclease SbcCD ATPase subunit